MEGTLNTRELTGRVYLALATALVLGVVVGGVVGFVGANQCTAEGFGCLGWIVYGLVAGVLLGVILAIWLLRRVPVAWPLLFGIVGGLIALGALAARMSAASQGLILAALAWPAVLLYARTKARGRAAAIFGIFGLCVVAICLATTWLTESRSIDFGSSQYARANVTVWGPADDSSIDGDTFGAFFSPVDKSLDYAYESGGNRVQITIVSRPGASPADGQVAAGIDGSTQIRHGDDVVTVRVTPSGSGERLPDVERTIAADLVARSPQWLATLDEPLHRLFRR